MEVLKVNGWKHNNRFFEVELTHQSYLDEQDVRGIASIFNCTKFAKDFLGCAFVGKFILKTQNGIWIHPCGYFIDEDISVDDDYFQISESEYLELK